MFLNPALEEKIRQVLEKMGVDTSQISSEMMGTLWQKAQTLMQHCRSCQTLVNKHWNYCLQCGAELQRETTTPEFGQKNCLISHEILKLGSNYCHNCGKKL